jgi:hypothetical protein
MIEREATEGQLKYKNYKPTIQFPSQPKQRLGTKKDNQT